jgi:hypothetical protein
MIKRLRKGLALALTMSLGLLVASSLWHHAHSQILTDFSSPNYRTADARATHSSEYCPVCLSHRLLTYACTQIAAEAPTTVFGFDCNTLASTFPSATFAFHSEARAPPLC